MMRCMFVEDIAVVWELHVVTCDYEATGMTRHTLVITLTCVCVCANVLFTVRTPRPGSAQCADSRGVPSKGGGLWAHPGPLREGVLQEDYSRKYLGLGTREEMRDCW